MQFESIQEDDANRSRIDECSGKSWEAVIPRCPSYTSIAIAKWPEVKPQSMRAPITSIRPPEGEGTIDLLERGGQSKVVLDYSPTTRPMTGALANSLGSTYAPCRYREVRARGRPAWSSVGLASRNEPMKMLGTG